jgi:TolB-like protein/lipoprotein NlpI
MSFLSELKRRNVVRVAIAYVVVAWLTAQVLQLIFQSFGTPDWVMKTVLVLMAAGLVFALFFSWAFELTPEGIKREKDVDRTQSIAPHTGKKLDFLIIGFLTVALAYFAFDKFVLDPARDAKMLEEAAVAEVDEPVPGDAEIDQSIAVLPFVNMSDDKDYFADGLSEELLNLLAKIPDLKVAGRTSSFVFKGRNEDLQAIGNALRVAHVLEGSVRRSGDRLRITAQLIKVEDGFHMWSETYDREMADIFDIQDEVASAITEALKLHLAPESGRPTEISEAYALYLEALALGTVVDGKDAFTGLDLLDQALAMDPAFAKAWELKAHFYYMAGGWVMDSPAAQAAAFEAANMALELDPTLIAAQTLATTAAPNWNWLNEVTAIERLVAVQPNNVNALVTLVYSLMNTGYFKDVLPHVDRIIELDPLSSVGYWRKGDALLRAGRRDEAHAAYQKAIELGGVIARDHLATDWLFQGKDELAIQSFQDLPDEYGQMGYREWGLEGVREFLDRARDPQNGKAFLDDFIEKESSSARNIEERVTYYYWYLRLGYLDEYFQAIETFGEGWEGWTNSDLLENYGMVFPGSGYVQHPKYLQRAASSGAIALWEVRGPPDHCKKVEGRWACG